MEQTFFLKSPTSSLTAEGCFERISTPAKDGADLTGKFQTAVSSAFERAKAAGIENPIVVGAIPFDPSQPSALYIPESWQTLEDSTVESLANEVASPDLRIVDLSGASKPPTGVPHEVYVDMVGQAVQAIKDGKLDKVVLSRIQQLYPPKPVNSRAMLGRLVSQNPHGYNFHLPLPDGSRLAGSSPELLVRKKGDRYESQPLAGSAGRQPDSKADEAARDSLMASDKDRGEHKLVVDWMRDVLEPVSVDLDAPHSPSTINTPRLWHLATKIYGTVVDKHESALSLAARLHPTPALSGFPHEKAHKLLTRLEPFDRKYFGGIVGYSDSEGNGEWFVAIRCCQLSNKDVTLFAGAGIVKDSVPESEWHETAVKLSTMQNVFT